MGRIRTLREEGDKVLHQVFNVVVNELNNYLPG